MNSKNDSPGIERVVQNQSLVNLSQQVDRGMNAAVTSCRDRSKNSNTEASTTADRQRQLYIDLDARIQELESSFSNRNVNVLDGGTLNAGGIAGAGWLGLATTTMPRSSC